MASEHISFSYSGKPADAQMYALCAASSREELERWATTLLYDMHTRQREDGLKETAAVWIGNKRFKPTVEQLEAHEARVNEVLHQERERKLLDSDDDDTLDVEIDDDGLAFGEESEVEESTEEVELEDEPTTSIMLDADDDLDF